MTRIKLPLLSALASAMWCMHAAALATQPCAGGIAGALVNASTGGSMSIGSNGSALSYATSSQSAATKITAGTTHLPGFSKVNASIGAETATQSAGTAYNSSIGSGSGWATSAGTVNAAAQGKLGIRGMSAADSGGSTGTQSSFAIHAARDQGSAVQGNTASGFETSLNFRRTGQTQAAGTPGSGVALNVSTTGYVTGTNASNALAGMNAAAVADIKASGYFKGFGQVGAATGTVTGP